MARDSSNFDSASTVVSVLWGARVEAAALHALPYLVSIWNFFKRHSEPPVASGKYAKAECNVTQGGCSHR